jgi:hypothetical protein
VIMKPYRIQWQNTSNVEKPWVNFSDDIKVFAFSEGHAIGAAENKIREQMGLGVKNAMPTRAIELTWEEYNA